MAGVTAHISESNALLRKAGIRLTIQQRGESLSLRGMFPARSGDGRRQQYLPLGIRANQVGVKQAIKIAHQVWDQLESGIFLWERWGVESPRETCRTWIAKYKEHFFECRGDTPKTHAAWQVHEWNQAIKLIDFDQPLTPEILIDACKMKKPNTRSRELCCQTLQRFAKFAGIDVDLLALKGHNKPKERSIPSDEQIEAALSSIPDPRWALVLKRMAAYGLRAHECWDCEISPDPPYPCRVVDGKTEGRTNVLPLKPEWAEVWKPWAGELPQVQFNGDRRVYGNRTSKALRRYGIEFKPHDFRHAYCLRGTVRYKIPIPIMAAMAGHSPEIHMRTYNRWLKEDAAIEAYLRAISQTKSPDQSS